MAEAEGLILKQGEKIVDFRQSHPDVGSVPVKWRAAPSGSRGRAFRPTLLRVLPQPESNQPLAGDPYRTLRRCIAAFQEMKHSQVIAPISSVADATPMAEKHCSTYGRIAHFSHMDGFRAVFDCDAR
jgi:hypothetical protein